MYITFGATQNPFSCFLRVCDRLKVVFTRCAKPHTGDVNQLLFCYRQVRLGPYSDATVVLTLPIGVAMADIAWFAVWDRLAAVS